MPGDHLDHQTESTYLSLLNDLLFPLIFERLYPPGKTKKREKKNRKDKTIKNATAETIAGDSSAEETEKLRKDGGNGGSEEVAQDYSEVSEFADYFSRALLSTLPSDPTTLDISDYTAPPDLLDSLISNSLATDTATAEAFITSLLSSFLPSLTPADPSETPIGVLRAAKPPECELCARPVPLTFHHLIPRQTHKKAVKRGWHKEEDLQKGAWVCRPCHNVIHRVDSNEGLARNYYTVEKLLEREEVQRWVDWVGGQRWKVKRG